MKNLSYALPLAATYLERRQVGDSPLPEALKQMGSWFSMYRVGTRLAAGPFGLPAEIENLINHSWYDHFAKCADEPIPTHARSGVRRMEAPRNQTVRVAAVSDDAGLLPAGASLLVGQCGAEAGQGSCSSDALAL
eukprot:17666-Rhodomonas_salina.2